MKTTFPLGRILFLTHCSARQFATPCSLLSFVILAILLAPEGSASPYQEKETIPASPVTTNPPTNPTPTTPASVEVKVAPLHEKIDQGIVLPLAPLVASPMEEGGFLRRLSLDLRNAVPTSDELKEFLADTDPSKRAKWIDRFLEDPLFSERMVNWLDLTLMERRNAQQVDRQAWLTWLRGRVDEGTALHELTKQIVGSEWGNRDSRPAQRFFLDREGDPNLITRDFGRIFFGRDMQCAQCHDHPLVADYLQRDYHGLLSFFSASSLLEVTYKDAESKDQKMKLYIEKAASDAPYESVFVKGKPHWASPTVFDGAPKWESYALPANRYAGPAADWIVGEAPKKPTESRRQSLALLLGEGQVRPFAANWSNRLWAMLFGEGLVHPLDMHHTNNPPDDPKLMDLITDGLIEHRFQTKPFLRELLLTQAYQRASRLPFEQTDEGMLGIELSTLRSELEALAIRDGELENQTKMAKDVWSEGVDALGAWEVEHVRLRNELTKSDATLADANKKVGEGTKLRDKFAADLATANQRLQLLVDGVTKLEEAKKLGLQEDAELAAAIQTAIAKREATKGAIPNLDQAAKKGQTDLDALLVAERAAQKAATDLAGSIETLRASWETQHQSIAKKRDDWRVLERERSVVKGRMAFVKQVLQWRATRQESASIASTMPVVEKGIVDATALVAMAQQQTTEMTQLLATIDTERKGMIAALTPVEERKARLQTELKLLSDTKSQLEASSKLLADAQVPAPTLEEIGKAISLRTSEIDTTAKEIETMKGSMATLDIRSVEATRVQQEKIEQLKIATAGKTEAESKRAGLMVSLEELKAKSDELSKAIAASSPDRMGAARLRPLSPEQLCWSILRVMGIMDQYVQNEIVELDKTQPLPVDPPATPQVQVARKRLAYQKALDKLRGNADQFAKLFAAGSGQADNYFASVDQALYLNNGGAVHSWSAPSGSNVTNRIVQATDPNVAAEDLYQTLLCRQPTPEEKQLVATCWSVPPEQKPALAQEMVWALLCSAEFRFSQ